MARRRRKKRYIEKYTILIGSIVLLNLVGVSYGYWSEGLQLTTSISTGKLDVEFKDVVFDESDEDTRTVLSGLLEIDENLKINNKGNSIEIEGKIPQEYDKRKVQLKYSLHNNGTIPAKNKMGEQIIIPVGDTEESTVVVILESDIYQTIDIGQFNE